MSPTVTPSVNERQLKILNELERLYQIAFEHQNHRLAFQILTKLDQMTQKEFFSTSLDFETLTLNDIEKLITHLEKNHLH